MFQDPKPPETTEPATSPLSPAQERFQSCRWRSTPEQGVYCSHRDVLPLAGTHSFNAEAWCPECEFYKLRRTPRKRPRDEFTY